MSSYKHKSDARRAAQKTGLSLGEIEITYLADGRYEWKKALVAEAVTQKSPTKEDTMAKTTAENSKKKKGAAKKSVADKPATKKTTKKTKGNGRDSMQSRLQALFSKKKKVSIAEIAEVLDTNERNAQVAVSILGSKKRTKNPVKTTYDRKTRIYTVI